jgi:hypothetical protein
VSSAGVGHDVSTEAGLKETVAQASAILGLNNVHVIHANDSKGELASHIDRHQHIGQGYIGLDGFRRILTHRSFVPKLLFLRRRWIRTATNSAIWTHLRAYAGKLHDQNQHDQNQYDHNQSS